MSPFKAICRDCDIELRGQEFSDVCDLMIEHHSQGRLEGSWTSGACGIFVVKETNNNYEEIEGKERCLESNNNVIVTPWVGEIVYNPKSRGKERG